MMCREAIAELLRSIDMNEPPSDAAREHLRSCERCRDLLSSISEALPAEEAAIDASAVAAEAAVLGERMKRTVKNAIAIVVAIIVFGLLMLIPLLRESNVDIAQLVVIAIAGVSISILAGLPLLLLFTAVAGAKTQRGERRFYKRLGPGRWLNGVCLGIAEGMKVNVSTVRLVFVALAWFKGVGLLTYIICSLAMPVHPADRQYMLRFKIARAWRRMRHA